MSEQSSRWGRAAQLGCPVQMFVWDKRAAAHAVEIAPGGIRLRCEEPPAEGAMLTIRLALPGDERAITALGRVVAHTPANGAPASFGVEFLDIRPHDRDRIVRFVEQAP